MTVLRSRVIKTHHSHKSLRNGVQIEPLTPAKEVEPTNKSSYVTTPCSDKLGLVDGTDSGFVSNRGLRRSARLCLKSSSYDVVENVDSTRKRKVVNIENDQDFRGINGSDGNEKESGASESVISNVKFSRVLDTASGCQVNGIFVSDSGAEDLDEQEMQSVRKVKSRSLPSVDVQILGSESVQVGDEREGCLKLRSGKKLLKPGFTHVADDKKHEMENKEMESEAVFNRVSEGGLTIEAKRGLRDNKHRSDKAWRRFSREDKKKWVSVDGDGPGELGLEKKMKTTAGEELERKSKKTISEEMEIDLVNDVNGTIKRDRSRHRTEEKGKGKVADLDSSSKGSGMKPKIASPSESTVADTVSLEQEANERAVTNTKRDYRESFKNIARKNASRFAHFSVQEEEEEEEDPLVDGAELELPQGEANGDVEDWPGPFSTALKIIKERAVNMHAQRKNLTLDKSHSVSLVWVPKEKQQCDRMTKVAPSLQDLCMAILADNVDAITSLESVPDVLRHKLTRLLCDRRKIDNHFFELLASGSPSEIRVRDCSWLTEEQLTKTFEGSDTSKLTVLQLDQCGRCFPDYVLFTTLAHSPNKLSALTNISLKGACRLSDAGLNVLVASAPALRSINLGCCSLLTSDGITNLADKLGPVLKELYIDECFGIDAMCILPALLKLEHLEVLSISRSETVSDSFVRHFVAVQGQKMKELILADCTRLTDKSLKAIAECCPGLCAIDLTNLCKLTDASIGYLANGCRTIQTMKLRCNAFSDEAVAAYLEACGEPLKELMLNHVDKVAHYTALSLARRARNLLSLDLSWCRNMTNEALGLIVDSCFSLKILKLFGCTQITNVFTDGHSNEQVKVIGLKGSQILKNIEAPDLLPLRYSSV